MISTILSSQRCLLIVSMLCMTGCGHLTKPSTQCPPIPEALTKPLPEMETAETPADVPGAYLHNMQACGVCYIRYNSLLEATESRQKED